MKSVVLLALSALLTSCGSVPVGSPSVELFKAECTAALTRHVRVWRILESDNGLKLDYEVAKHGRSSFTVTGDAATAIRGRLNAMRWFHLEDEALRLGSFGSPQLRPFDGNFYRFTVYRMGAVRHYGRDNPWFDLQERPESDDSIALKELLEFLDFIERIAMRKMANKAPEPTPGLVTPRAMECASEMKRRNGRPDAARGAPSPVVAHL